VELENFSFTFIDDDAASELWQKIFFCILAIALFPKCKCGKCGAAVEY
jgi:hypothetical protein